MRGRDRLADVMMPMPSSASAPIPIHTIGACSMYAAIASAMIRTTQPMNDRLNQFTAYLRG